MAALLDLAALTILDRAEPPAGSAAAVWPCPGCGERRSLARSWHVLVRNRTGAPLERWVRICAPCADGGEETALAVTVADAASRTVADGAATSVVDLAEPWLRDLAEVTAIMRAIDGEAPAA